ncbi:uncharacterized protein [Dermacentor albipictus]|uniref:uncharacterized protein n=1 Tax=Dermacentor albipictus TaxID=60249 RepID=UPI0038FD1E96
MEAPQNKVRRRARPHVGMITPALDAETNEVEPVMSAGQVKQQQEQGAGGETYAAPRLATTEGGEAKCNTPLCRHMKDWFDVTVGSQADPCKERNTFVCHTSVAFPSFDLSPPKGNRPDDASFGKKRTTSDADGLELMKSCLEYAWNPADGVQDVLSFLQHFNLDLRRMADDPAEEPLHRMMQLSFDYGVGAPVSFSRKYDVTAEAPAPFALEITLNPEVKEFASALQSLEEDDVDDLYQFLLAHYALVDDANVTEQLMDADEQIAEFMNRQAAGSMRPLRMNVRVLSNTTGIATDRWKQLFARFGFSEHAVNEHVTANEQALALVAYLSRTEERLAMRRVLAWNVLRYLVGPKADVVAALNWTRDEEAPPKDAVVPTPETKCQRLVARLSGLPRKVFDLFEGEEAVSAATISDVTSLMAELQDAVASIFKYGATNGSSVAAKGDSAPSPTASSTTSQAVVLPGSRRLDAHARHPFEALGGAAKSTAGTVLEGPGGSFPKRWLRRLRAWHALPPLAQALLPAMTSAVSVDSPATFFRPPFYVPRAPPSYNLAALGQVIARALAHEVVERRRANPAVRERWRTFWESSDAADGDSTYCVQAGLNTNGTWRQHRLNESELADRARLDEVLGSRIAYVAFQRTRLAIAGAGRPTTELPGVNLSSKQLFFVMHCALGCAMGGDRDPARSPADHHQRCMVVYQTRKRLVDRPCGQFASGNIPNDCRYI